VTTTAYRTVTDFTATAGQTSFSVPSYTVGYIDVFRNGVRLAAADFTATTGTTVVLANACTVGDTVTTVSFYVSSVLNAIPPIAGSVYDTYIASVSASKLTGTQTIPKATLPAGSVLQVVQTTKTDSFSTTSTSYVTFITVSITPTSASSKVLVTFGANGGTAGDVAHGYLGMFRGATQLFKADAAGSRTGATSVINTGTQQQLYYGGTFLDSPATTSSTTYTIQVLSSNGQAIYLNRSGRDNNAPDYDGRSVSSITVMEISA
jgi:hypothetical protein